MSLSTVTEEHDMNRNCVVPGCKGMNRNLKSTDAVTLYPVPRNKQMLQKWQDAIPGEVELMQGQKICSAHFRKNDIIRVRDMNHVGRKKEPRYRTILLKNAVPYFFPDEATHYGTWKKEKSDPPCTGRMNTRGHYYNSLGLNPFFACTEVSIHDKKNIVVKEKNDASNLLDQNQTQQIARLDQCVKSDMSDCESDPLDIEQDISISDFRENIQNELNEYAKIRSDLEQTLDQFTFDNLLQGNINIKIPQNWYKVIPDTVDRMVVFGNFVMRSDELDQMLVSYKSVCVREDGFAQCSILNKRLDSFPSECIKSYEQLETLINKLNDLPICKGVVLGKEFAYSYSQTCFLDKQGHWRHITCDFVTARGYDTCIACTKVLPILLQLKGNKKPGPKGRFERM